MKKLISGLIVLSALAIQAPTVHAQGMSEEGNNASETAPIQQRIDFILAERFRQRTADTRHLDLCRRIVAAQAFAHDVAEEAAEARQLPRRRTRFGTTFDALGDKIEQIRFFGELDRNVAF